MPSLHNRYEVLRPIASGGMATVYLGVAHAAGGFERTVAIKVMHPGLSKDPNFVAMFFDEARIAARIRHMNVVATLDVAEDADGGLCLIMEYVEGHSLRDIVRVLREQRANIPLEVGLRIILEVLTGLHAAHDLTYPDGGPLELVHRDISPHNILVSNDGIAKLTDFGIARAERRLAWTRAGQIKGKLAYMAIEQMRGKEVDRRADIYAMGVVLWELLTGQRLFTGAHEGTLALAVCNGATTAPHEVSPDVPQPLSLACMRALRADPEQRYPTAAGFADALEAAATDGGVEVATQRAVAALCAEVARHRKDAPPTSGSHTRSVLRPLTDARRWGDTRMRRVTELGLAERRIDQPEIDAAARPRAQSSLPPSTPTAWNSDAAAPSPVDLPATDTARSEALACAVGPTTRYATLTAPPRHRSMPFAGAVGGAFAVLLSFVCYGGTADRAFIAAAGVRSAVVAAAAVTEAVTGTVTGGESPAAQTSTSVAAKAAEVTSSTKPLRSPHPTHPRPVHRALRARPAPPTQEAPSSYRPIDL